MSESKTKIILQRKNPKKPYNWCDWEWIYPTTTNIDGRVVREQDENKLIAYLNKWIKDHKGDGNEYRIARIRTIVEVVYQVGDFISYNEGMGEHWFGTIKEVHSDHVVVTAYKADYLARVTRVSNFDITGIADQAMADAYYKARRGGGV